MRLGRRRLSLVLQALQFYNDAYMCGIKSGDYVCSVSCKCEKQMCVTDGALPIASPVLHRPTRLRLALTRAPPLHLRSVRVLHPQHVRRGDDEGHEQRQHVLRNAEEAPGAVRGLEGDVRLSRQRRRAGHADGRRPLNAASTAVGRGRGASERVGGLVGEEEQRRD